VANLLPSHPPIQNPKPKTPGRHAPLSRQLCKQSSEQWCKQPAEQSAKPLPQLSVQRPAQLRPEQPPQLLAKPHPTPLQGLLIRLPCKATQKPLSDEPGQRLGKQFPELLGEQFPRRDVEFAPPPVTSCPAATSAENPATRLVYQQVYKPVRPHDTARLTLNARRRTASARPPICTLVSAISTLQSSAH
jgi:hypothetical protein